MQCPSCGAEAPNDALFCPKCETKLESIWQAPRISDTPQEMQTALIAGSTIRKAAKWLGIVLYVMACISLVGLVAAVTAVDHQTFPAQIYTQIALVGGILIGIAARKRGKSRIVSVGIGAFLGVSLTLLLIFGVAFIEVFSKQSFQTRTAAKEGARLYDDIASGVEIERKQYSQQQYGEVASLLQFMNDWAIAVQLIGEPQVFSRKILSSKESIGNAQARLLKIRGVYESSKTSNLKLFDEMREGVHSLDVPLDEELKQVVLSGFYQSQEEAKRLTMRTFDIEMEIIDAEYQMLDYMKSRRYHFQGEQVIFATQAGVDQFDQYRKQIDKLSREQFALQQVMQTRMKQYSDELAKLVVELDRKTGQ